MKDLIERLAEQCTTIYNSTTFPVDKDFDYEKFARLIAAECAEFIAPMGDYCGGHGEPSAPSSRECARRLKQHFGVEE
jgi:hypothetical protein